MADFETRLSSVIPDLMQKCDDALTMCRRTSTGHLPEPLDERAVLKTVRVGHSDALLDIKLRLSPTDVHSAYDECMNAVLPALIMRIVDGNTKTMLNSLTLANDFLTKDGRALLIHVHCLLAKYPTLDTEEYIDAAKALRVTESDDPPDRHRAVPHPNSAPQQHPVPELPRP
ncbi:hypothetical protein CYMTET_42263 [Cymbomonas tetramitiformis]|uniref:Uncharacterized protein n=1 Tax=Cymbomonas tetramitiformis TaxID=36881 RepID=A0AAE0C5J4_9CHLO|nr:hypothetical protein CYMTET_42263 [Cymbomonas tetramitiformis]